MYCRNQLSNAAEASGDGGLQTHKMVFRSSGFSLSITDEFVESTGTNGNSGSMVTMYSSRTWFASENDTSKPGTIEMYSLEEFCLANLLDDAVDGWSWCGPCVVVKSQFSGNAEGSVGLMGRGRASRTLAKPSRISSIFCSSIDPWLKSFDLVLISVVASRLARNLRDLRRFATPLF